MKSWVEQARGQTEGAQETLELLINHYPRFLPPYTELAKIYFEQKEYDVSEQVLKKLLGINKKNLHARTELSKLYQRQKNWEKAEKVLVELIEIEPDNIHGCTENALLYKRWANDLRLMNDDPFIKFKARFQAMNVSIDADKKLQQLNNIGTFHGFIDYMKSHPGQKPFIQTGQTRYPLLEDFTIHQNIKDGYRVFFANYQIKGKGEIYADFIEPYFQDVKDLSFFAYDSCEGEIFF